MTVMYVLILIAWSGTLATIPGYMNREACESSGEQWRVLAKDIVASPRYVCIIGQEQRR